MGEKLQGSGKPLVNQTSNDKAHLQLQLNMLQHYRLTLVEM